MNSFFTLMLVVGLPHLGASVAMAQEPPHAGAYHLTLAPPDPAAPPLPEAEAQARAQTLGQLFGAMDANQDRVLASEEFAAWVRQVTPPTMVWGQGQWLSSGTTVNLAPSVVWSTGGSVVVGSAVVRTSGALTTVPGVMWSTGGSVVTSQGTWNTVPGNMQVNGSASAITSSGTWISTGGVTVVPWVVFSQGTWTISPGQLEGAGSPSAPPACPECSAELADLEQRTQFPDIPCGAGVGTLRLRTICNLEGLSSQTIYVPDGHDADCFHIEAQAGGQVAFAIYPETNPNNIIFSSQRDGLDHLGAVHLNDTGVYRIDLDLAVADPGSRVSIGCVTHPE